MDIIYYPHPTLRHKSKVIRRVDQKLKDMVADMFELMYAAKGIGLAANQVNLPFQLFIINTTGDAKTGEEMVFVNPVVDQPKGTDVAEEGCLSVPGLNGDVNRPAQVHISAYDLLGNEIDETFDGLLARAIQHEQDHLNGVMFFDRMSESDRKLIEGEIQIFELDFEGHRAAGRIGDDEAIRKHIADLESQYC